MTHLTHFTTARILSLALLGLLATSAARAGMIFTYEDVGVMNTTVANAVEENFTDSAFQPGQMTSSHAWSADGVQIGTYTNVYMGTYNPFPTTADGNPADHSLPQVPFTTVINGAPDEATPMTLTLNTPQNYFGMEWLAIDGGNVLTFYDQNNDVIGVFNVANVTSLLPTTYQYGGPYSQYYAYLNFYATDGAEISKIVWSESPKNDGGFEQTNDAVALLPDDTPITGNPGGTLDPSGTTLTPEPASCALLGGGLGLLALCGRKLRRA
jgi:hypothetical protein